MALGTEIKKARIDRGWDQGALCQEAHISRKYLSQMENNHVDPRISIVTRIADALGIDINVLLGRNKKA